MFFSWCIYMNFEFVVLGIWARNILPLKFCCQSSWSCLYSCGVETKITRWLSKPLSFSESVETSYVGYPDRDYASLPLWHLYRTICLVSFNEMWVKLLCASSVLWTLKNRCRSLSLSSTGFLALARFWRCQNGRPMHSKSLCREESPALL